MPIIDAVGQDVRSEGNRLDSRPPLRHVTTADKCTHVRAQSLQKREGYLVYAAPSEAELIRSDDLVVLTYRSESQSSKRFLSEHPRA